MSRIDKVSKVLTQMRDPFLANKDEYLNTPHFCPFRRSDNLAFVDRDYTDKFIFEYHECADCNQTWRDEYILTDIVKVEP